MLRRICSPPRLHARVRAALAIAAWLALASPPPVLATPITGGSGLSSPGAVIEFDEVGGLVDFQAITNEFSLLGATFDNFVWDGSNTFGQSAASGIDGINLLKPAAGTAQIFFTIPVTAAAFAVADADVEFTVQALLGGGLVEEFSLVIPPALAGGSGFIGFENIVFDEIRLAPSANTGLALDTLQFNVIPEPHATLLFAVGALVAGSAIGRRARRSPRPE